MTKYFLILLLFYFLYYAGNIAYDLFLKKEKKQQTETTQEYSFADFANSEYQSPFRIEIEDVENMKPPNSFYQNDFLSKENEEEANLGIEDWRKKFEDEQEMIEISFIPKKFEKDESLKPKNEVLKSKKMEWESLLKLSETTVQMVANYEGQKVYQSII